MKRYETHPAFEYQVNDKISFYCGYESFEDAAMEWIEEFMDVADMDDDTGDYRLKDGRYIEIFQPKVELTPPWKYYLRNKRPRWLYAYHWKRLLRELHRKLRKSLRSYTRDHMRGMP